MKVEKLIGKAIYQVEATPKRGRTPQRFDMVCDTEFEIPRVRGSETVADAVVATGYFDGELDLRPGRRRARPTPQTYLGYSGGLWQPLKSHYEVPGSITVDDLRLRLQQNPTEADRGTEFADPMMSADDPEVGFAQTRHRRNQNLRSESSFDGHVHWSNKPRALQLQHEVSRRLLLIVDDTIYRRSEGPTWTVSDSKSYPYHQGAILLVQADRQEFHGDRFAVTKLDLARAWCEKRWGKVVISGSVEYVDPRFIDGFDGARLMRRRLGELVEKGLNFVPYWPVEAVDSYLALAWQMRISEPLQLFGVRDPQAVLALAKTLRAHLSAPSIPTSLKEKARDIFTEMDRMDRMIENDPSLVAGLDPTQEAALEGLAVP